MAAGYATHRPALHARIVDSACTRLGLHPLGECVVDIGCGSGLSTEPLVGRSRLAIGIEPVWEMARCARFVAPRALFINGFGERMPFADSSVDAMTAAGSLNFAHPATVLREAWRALKPSGLLLAYDFAQGSSFTDGAELSQWFDQFLKRYPRQPSEAISLDPEKLALLAENYDVAASLEFDWTIPYDCTGYAGYMMTETNVAAAIRQGEPETAIRDWLNSTLSDIFGGQQRHVVFPGYWVALRKPGRPPQQ